MAPNEQAHQFELKCKYCGKQYKSAKWLEAHEETCAKNSSVAQKKPQAKTKAASKPASKSTKKPLQSNVAQNNVNNYEWVLCEDGYYYSQQGNILYCYDPYTNQYFSQYYDPRAERRRKMWTTIGAILGSVIAAAVIILYCFLSDYTSSSSASTASFKWDGTWSTAGENIVVTLNSSTMKAEVQLFNGDVKYTTEWEIIDNNSIVWSDYASSQYTMMTKDGHLYSYNSRTGRITDSEVYMYKR